MKAEKITLVFGDIEYRKDLCAKLRRAGWRNESVNNRRINRSTEIIEFRIGNSDIGENRIVPSHFGMSKAKFKIKLIKKIPKDSKFERYFWEKNYNDIDNVQCFYALSRRLKAICDIDGPYADILYKAWDNHHYPIICYRYIDNDHGKLSIYFENKNLLGFKKKNILAEAVVSKKDLLEAFYVGFIKQIIKYYDGPTWFGGTGGYRGDPGSNLYTFFNKRIDKYLKANGVKDIDKLVQQAKDKIKADLLSIYEEWDADYDHIIY